jgi:uncharacterized protein YgfB (UPF0149 family)
MLEVTAMSTAPLPDFERTVALGGLEAIELAECHGVVCGLLCRMPDASLDTFITLLDMLELVNKPGSALRMALQELLNASREQLADENMGLVLWLPADNEMLEERTMALAQWCSGFLAGLGSGGEHITQALSEDAVEALRDLQQIAKAVVADTSETEEEESAFVEIVEYVRVVVLMIREDMRGPDAQDQIH